MKMNRRNALIGLGSLAVGGGALFGSGAFSQVEADRTITIDVAGDTSAFVGIEEVGTRDSIDTTGNAVQVDLSSGLYTAGDGVNDQATIRIGDGDIGTNIGAAGEGCLKVVNNTDVATDLEVTVTDTGDLASFNLYWLDSGGGTGSGTTVSEAGVASGDGIEFAIELETNGNVTTNPTLTVTATQ